MASLRSGKTIILLLPDIAAMLATTVVFVVTSVTDIGSESLVQATCGALALFSMSLLVIRLTTLEKMDNSLTRLADTLRDHGPLRVAISEQSARMRALTDFLTNGALDVKLLNAAATELLESDALAHLVTINEDGSAQVSCVWVGLDGGDIVVGHQARRLKVRNVERDPRVVLSIE